jgi:DNA-binding NtrC family response regulator
VETSRPRTLVIIDRQHYWLEFSSAALQLAGYDVHTYDMYSYISETKNQPDVAPVLIIFGCMTMQAEEWEFVQHLLDCKCALLILCTSLSWEDMRASFRAGAIDVIKKPYDAEALVEIVDATMDIITSRSKHKFEHQRVQP